MTDAIAAAPDNEATNNRSHPTPTSNGNAAVSFLISLLAALLSFSLPFFGSYKFLNFAFPAISIVTSIVAIIIGHRAFMERRRMKVSLGSSIAAIICGYFTFILVVTIALFALLIAGSGI